MAKIIRTKPRDGRKLPPNEPKRYEIAEMRNRHYRIAELAFLGYSNKHIARLLGVSEQNVYEVLASRIVKDYIATLQEQREARTVDIARQIKEIAPEALRVLRTSLLRENQRLLNDPGAQVDRLHASIAQDILDRAGYQPPRASVNAFLHLRPEDLDGIKRASMSRRVDAEHRVVEENEGSKE